MKTSIHKVTMTCYITTEMAPTKGTRGKSLLVIPGSRDVIQPDPIANSWSADYDDAESWLTDILEEKFEAFNIEMETVEESDE